MKKSLGVLKGVLELMLIASMTTAFALAAQPTPVNLSFTNSPNPLSLGQMNDINVNVADQVTLAPVTVGRVHVYLKTYTDPVTNTLRGYASCETANGQSLDQNLGNTLNAAFPSAVASFLLPSDYPEAAVGVAVSYEPAGSGYAHSTLACVDVPVAIPSNPCIGGPGLNIYEAGVGGPDVLNGQTFQKGTGGTGTWQLQIMVENCTPNAVTNVKAQGGTSAWTTPSVAAISGANPTAGGLVFYKSTAKNKSGGTNYVIIWNIPSMAAYDREFVTVDLTGTIQCGQTLPLNGAWSVLSTETPKSNYTGFTYVFADCQ